MSGEPQPFPWHELPQYGDARARRAKFGNRQTEIDGYRFDSKREAEHYLVLRDRLKHHQIANLVLQPTYRIEHAGIHICDVVPDFAYVMVADRRLVVEDVKSPVTAKHPVYRLKKKLLLAFHGISVNEVL